MGTGPPAAVVHAFGVRAEPVPLPGGEGVAYRAGPVVLKRAHDPIEASWVQALLARLPHDGFRVAEPVPTVDGGWVAGSWIASAFVADLRPVAPRWHRIAEIGLHFGAAAERVLPQDCSPLDARTHRWAEADRVAWGERAVALPAAATEVRRELATLLLAEPSGERRFVHGDLTGNVLVDGGGTPVVLDVSPYLRDPRWAATIVVADAVLWHGADLSLAVELAGDPAERDLLGRALIFRLVAEQLASQPRRGATLAPYRHVLTALQ